MRVNQGFAWLLATIAGAAGGIFLGHAIAVSVL
jgi:hypothetical protein